jgi:hypothetical protein
MIGNVLLRTCAGFITSQELSLRPTGRYVQELWRLHGPVAQQGGAALLTK